MELHLLKPRISLNKAFLKVKPNRPEIGIDKLVCQLYGLTEEEIKIVEGEK